MSISFFRRLLVRCTTTSPILLPFLAAALIHVLAYLVRYPAQLAAMQSLLPPSLSDQDHAVAGQLMTGWEPVRVLFLPIRLLIGWTSFSLALFYGVRFAVPPEPVRMRQIISLVFVAEILTAFGALARSAIPSSTGTFPIPPAPMSIAAFVPSPSWVMATIFGYINPFHIGYVLVLAWGVSLASGFGKTKSIVLVLFVWAVAVFSQICLMQYAAQEVRLAM